jgi:succinylarginine dihydrolase
MHQEINFDGIVGNTHHYGGLATGNIASLNNKKNISNPKKAALQGLEKMKKLSDLGLLQAVLPPHERPFFPELIRRGYTGNAFGILEKVSKNDIGLLSAMCSSASMWVANSATVTPAIDSNDKKVHLTISNMASQGHRAIESGFNFVLFKTLLADNEQFSIHAPLRGKEYYDEGAANHMRLQISNEQSGFNIFVYGKNDNKSNFPLRQSKKASENIIKKHEINLKKSLLIEQNPRVVDTGVFHNDVIATSHENLLLYHEKSWADSKLLFDFISNNQIAESVELLEVSDSELSVEDAVQCYLFNSQLLSISDNNILLLADKRCNKNKNCAAVIKKIIASKNRITKVMYVDLEQSMRNGGGPACLRLRMQLTKKQLASINGRVLLDDLLYKELVTWIKKYYRESLAINDLKDPLLYKENMTSLDALTKIMKLGSIYDFQR